jgi:hypothetical protein
MPRLWSRRRQSRRRRSDIGLGTGRHRRATVRRQRKGRGRFFAVHIFHGNDGDVMELTKEYRQRTLRNLTADSAFEMHFRRGKGLEFLVQDLKVDALPVEAYYRGPRSQRGNSSLPWLSRGSTNAISRLDSFRSRTSTAPYFLSTMALGAATTGRPLQGRRTPQPCRT